MTAYNPISSFADTSGKGYYATAADLVAAYPVGENGWNAIIGETDTFWIWDEDAHVWHDSETGSGSSAIGDMLKADNLSGLINYATARTNLGLGSLATQNGTFSGTSSGTNTGDETDTTIKTKLGISTLSGSNTGDQQGGDATNNISYLNIPQNSQSAAYTTVLGDSGKHIYHPSADTTDRTWTIDSNAHVQYPIGTAITFVNDTSAGVLTIAITSDTLILAGAGTTGNRTLAANGVATAMKIGTTRWIISGTNLT